MAWVKDWEFIESENWKTPYGSCTMLMSSTFFYTKQNGLPEVGIEDRWVIRTFNYRCSMQQLPSKYCNKCTPYCNQRQNNLSIFYRSTRNSTAWGCYWPINRGNGSIFSRKLPKRNPLIDRFDHRYVVLPPLEMFSLSVLRRPEMRLTGTYSLDVPSVEVERKFK